MSEPLREQIAAYLADQLTPAEKQAFERELERDPELRIEFAELEATWQELGRLPEEQPSAALRARFYQKLHDIDSGRASVPGRGFAWWKPGLSGLVRQAAAAIVLLLLGWFAGRESLRRAITPAGDTGELRSEVQDLRRTVALTMLDKESPSSRLEGVSWSTRVDKLDPQLLTALVNTLNQDGNTNVRLSALDALEKFSDEPGVRKQLIDSLGVQKSPLVQIALIDALVHMRDRDATGELQKLSKGADVNAAVQQRAKWGLEKLKS
ncbi:MAG TPA: HEAT repeat domain-containing protein [Bryobacteraceae bacterium]|jgi:hypothetical protein|nr:HEAT repeat domain-containing protein [Bryobacteraceae bacterium]